MFYEVYFILTFKLFSSLIFAVSFINMYLNIIYVFLFFLIMLHFIISQLQRATINKKKRFCPAILNYLNHKYRISVHEFCAQNHNNNSPEKW